MVATPTEERLITQIYVKLDGADLAKDMMGDLLRARIESSAHLPDLAIIEFDNEELTWSQQNRIQPGQDIKVYFGEPTDKSNEPVFAGEVTAIEVDMRAEATTSLIVRCYDRAHRLHRGRATRVFKQTRDSDMAQAIAGEVGLTSEVQNTEGVRDWVLQDNQTNWEFLQELRARNGYELQVRDDKLVFKEPPSIERAPVTLVWDEELISFRATMTTGEQVNKVEVRGWDPVDKKEIIGRAERPNGLPEVGESRPGGDVAKSAFKMQPVQMGISRQPIYDQEQANHLAQSVLDELSGVFITASGVAMGNQNLRVGSEVTIKDVGDQFSGKYSVTQVTHSYEPEDYKVYFEATGRRSTDLVTLLASPPLPRVRILTGLVNDLNDPLNLGRVNVKLPTLGSDIVSDWCRVLSPGGGNERGWQFLPEVDDEVLLIGDSMDNLYVLGGLWNSMDLPPLPNDEAWQSRAVVKRVIQTRLGHKILFEDPAGSSPGGTITIVDSAGNKIVLDADKGDLTAETSNNMNFKAAGSIKFEANANFSVSAMGNIDQSAMGSLTVEGTGNATLKGTGSVRVESSGNASLSAPTVSLG